MACNCVGDWCTCNPGHRVAKDGTTVHVPLMMKDSAMSETPTMDTMPTAIMTLDEALNLPRYAGMQPGNARQYATRDLATVQAGDYAKGLRDGSHALYQQRTSDAWKAPAPVNDNQTADPVVAKDGRPFAQLSDSEKARERMARDQSEAWKR